MLRKNNNHHPNGIKIWVHDVNAVKNVPCKLPQLLLPIMHNEYNSPTVQPTTQHWEQS
jgi:hypothetical protein